MSGNGAVLITPIRNSVQVFVCFCFVLFFFCQRVQPSYGLGNKTVPESGSLTLML